jgi:hypothetical protein
MGFRFLIHSSSDARLLRAALADSVCHIREGEAHRPAVSSSAGVPLSNKENRRDGRSPAVPPPGAEHRGLSSSRSPRSD